MSSSNAEILSPRRKKKKTGSPVLAEEEHELPPNVLPIDESPCDCTETDCPGCFYPCESCGSVKCGPECRVGREWKYESVIVQGK